jgi:hypothetical protein
LQAAEWQDLRFQSDAKHIGHEVAARFDPRPRVGMLFGKSLAAAGVEQRNIVLDVTGEVG